MKNLFWTLFVWICLLNGAGTLSAQYIVRGGEGTPLEIEQSSSDKAERLKVYVVQGSRGLSISYTSTSEKKHQWYRYKTKRLEAEPVASTQVGQTSTVNDVEPEYGYFVEEGAVSNYVWLVDYSRYSINLSQISLSDISDPCGGLVLKGEGSIPSIYYYWPNSGTRRTLKRQFEVHYQTMSYDADKRTFETVNETTAIEGNLFEQSIPAPLCDTEICVKGDAFARHFGMEKTWCMDNYRATAIEAHIDTLVVEQSAENMNSSKAGICAPAEVEFTAIANQPTAALFQWVIYPVGEEENVLLSFSGETMNYTFNQAGSFVAKLTVSDQQTTCVVEDEVQIDISESYLKIPNAFSPGTTPGVNDEFKVAYKSLVRFKGTIFNRWGLKLFEWSDPAQGWDGKQGGKYVVPGVYFYVIEAEGSDGIKYKEKGDINILRPKTVTEQQGVNSGNGI